MSKKPQLNLSGGELTPSLHHNADLVKYMTGLKTQRNCVTKKAGGVTNRAGTKFITACALPSSTKRLVKLKFGSTYYLVELGDGYGRLFDSGNDNYYETAQNITAITNANPCVVTYSGADTYANGDQVYISGIVGDIGKHLNGNLFTVANRDTGANTFELQSISGSNINSTSFGSYTSGGSIEEIKLGCGSVHALAKLPRLQFLEVGVVVEVVHPDSQPYYWYITGTGTFGIQSTDYVPSIAAPSPVSNSGAAGTVTYWKVTSVELNTDLESLPSSATSTSATPTGGAPITVSWSANADAKYYNIYKLINGIYGYIGSAEGTSFSDTGITPDVSESPPYDRGIFASGDNYPGVVCAYQNRQCYFRTNNSVRSAWLTNIGGLGDISGKYPIVDTGSILFSLVKNEEIRHAIDLGKLILFTKEGEWVCQGGADGILTPSQINAKKYSHNGSSYVPPIVMDNNALYLQIGSKVVKDFAFDYQVDGYRGSDLTVFASHLFEGTTVVDWAYQKVPNSIVWAVRSDGVVIALTYNKEHEIIAWHKHDFSGGLVENVCVFSDSNDQEQVYFVIKRTIDGGVRRYIEKLTSREFTDIEDAVFMDSSLTYDGTNAAATTMTLSGGTNWTYDETLTITASASFFSASEVGNEIHFTMTDGSKVRFVLEAYTSVTVMTGKANRTVPAALRSAATATWARAVDTLGGLWHIEGEDVSVFGDGFVVASPNNDSYDVVTVTNGIVELAECYAVIHVGLPYLSDINTLALATQGSGMSDKKKLVTSVLLHLEDTRGVFVGPEAPSDDATDPLENMIELKLRDDEDMNDPVALKNGAAECNFEGQWNDNGEVFIRQVDPLPMTINGIEPAGFIPFGG